MDIRTMPAGPELDLQMHEALGYIPWTEQRGEYTHVVFQSPGGRPPYMGSRDWESKMGRYKEIAYSDIDRLKHILPEIPRYSTTWSDAGQIMEEMKRRGHDVSVWTDMNGRWGSEIGTAVAEDMETGPLAITVAAILALREEAGG